MTPAQERKRLRDKLAAVRQADAEHEQMMRAALEGSGVTLEEFRRIARTGRCAETNHVLANILARAKKARAARGQ